MLALAAREFLVAAGTAAIPIASLAVAALLSAFVLAWAPGMPVLAPLNLYEQARALSWALLAVALPWTAVRSAPMDRADVIVLLAGLARVSSASAILAKVLASFAVQTMVVLGSVPALVLAQQSAAVPLPNLIDDLLAMCGLALLVAALSTASMLFAPDALRAWLRASLLVSAVLVAAVMWAPEATTVGLVCATGGMFATLWLWSAPASRRPYSGA